MNWFLVFSFVAGILLALIPKFITKNIKKAIESDKWVNIKGFEDRRKAEALLKLLK
jgi:hypothetical protein